MSEPAAFRERAARWFSGSVNRRILGAALTVGAVSAVVKVAAMVKELVVAYQFGTGDVIDAFLIAFLGPALVVNVFAGSLGVAFTPVYVAVRDTQGRPAAFALMRRALAGGLTLALLVSVLLVLLLPLLPHLARGFSPEKVALTRTLALLLLPIVLLNALVALWSAVLNCEDRFAWTALAPMGVPLATLMVVAFAAQLGGYALAVGTVVGYVLQCGVLMVVLANARLPILPRWSGDSPELRRVWRQSIPTIASAVLSNGNWVIGQAMAATLAAGSVAALNYGFKIPSVATELGSMALATAVFPHFSTMVARRAWADIRHTLRVYARLIALVTIPLTVLGIVLSPLIVRLLFQRGAFSPTDTDTVATIQGLYLVQIPFVMVGMLFVRLASSLQRNQILLVGSFITLPLNVILNALFMRWLGAAGIALATSLVFIVSCGYLVISVTRTMRAIERAGHRSPTP